MLLESDNLATNLKNKIHHFIFDRHKEEVVDIDHHIDGTISNDPSMTEDIPLIIKSDKKNNPVMDPNVEKHSPTMHNFFKKKKNMIYTLCATILFIIFSSTFYYVAEKDWGLLDSVWFSLMTLLTIGYGDLTPTHQFTKGMTILIIFFSIAIVGYSLGVFASFFMEKQEEKFQKFMNKETMKTNHKKKALVKFIIGTLIVFLILLIGTIFFKFVENWSVIDSLYFCVTTCATIGYGDLVPHTFWGRLFNIFYMVIGTAFFLRAIGQYLNIFVESYQEGIYEKVLHEKFTRDLFKKMDLKGDNRVDLLEFLEYKLVALGHVTQNDMKRIKELFFNLDVTHTGYLDERDIITSENNDRPEIILESEEETLTKSHKINNLK